MDSNVIPESVDSRQAFDAWWRENVSRGTPTIAALAASAERGRPAPPRQRDFAGLRSAIVTGFSQGFGEEIARETLAARADWISDPNSAACVEAAEKRATERKIPLLQAARELHSEAVHHAALEAVERAHAAGRVVTYRQAVTNLTRRAVR